MQAETLMAFLSDEILRKKLKEKYRLSDSDIGMITMTSQENFLEVVLIKELIKKQAENSTSNIASAQLINMLDGRLTQIKHENT